MRKLLGLLATIIVFVGCERKDDVPLVSAVPAPFSCNHVITNYQGLLDGTTNFQSIAVNTNIFAFPHDHNDIALCKGGLNCDTLSVLLYNLAPNKITIFDGDKLFAQQGWDSYFITATQCR